MFVSYELKGILYDSVDDFNPLAVTYFPEGISYFEFLHDDVWEFLVWLPAPVSLIFSLLFVTMEGICDLLAMRDKTWFFFANLKSSPQ